MKNFVLVLLVLALAGAALSQPTEYVPVTGPFNLPSNYTWTRGPLGTAGEFEVAAHPLGWSFVLTGANCSITKFEPGTGLNREVWTRAGGRLFPKPGLVLSPGTYRVFDSSFGNFVWGYFAPATGEDHSGYDSYPARDRLWQAHRWLDGTLELQVPAGKVYYMTYCYQNNLSGLEFWNGSQWTLVLQFTAEMSNMLTTPGIRLPSGSYRMYTSGDPNIGAFCGGYIARTDW